ncbi:MAG: hypothetical protein RMJ55_16415 [Roseiflexaceae bacterium]|nr:hypothetical protein [Roseiflexaceae bacterium]
MAMTVTRVEGRRPGGQRRHPGASAGEVAGGGDRHHLASAVAHPHPQLHS